MYHPPDPNVQEIAAGFDDADEFEFIELTNVSGQTIDLRTIRFVQTQIDGDTVGIAFDFQGSELQELEPGEQVLVVENRDAFTARYGAGLPVAGQWQGGLSNSSETITLLATQTLLQSITYRDAWHPATDGEGASLEIRNVADNDLDAWNQAAAWTASTIAGGSPGRHPSHGVVGDSNGDGRFNSSDLVSVFIAGKYEDDIPGNATFSEGDWNGDGDFTTRDLVYAFQFGNYLPNAIPLHATPARLSAVRDVAFAEWHDGEPVWLRFRKPGMKLPPWTGESLADGDLP
jgi:hypothetical protein